MQTQPFEITDFTGGITDYFIDGPSNKAERMDNLFITPNMKPRTRWGSRLFIENQIPLGLFRINHLRFLDDDLLTFAQRRVYSNDGNDWVELVGPGGDALFPLGDANSLISSDEWQGHLFVANNSFSPIQKIFRDNTGTFQARNAGLPEVNPVGVDFVGTGTGFSYLYSLNYKYTYQVDGVTFIDRGPTLTSENVESAEIGPNTANITLSPTLLVNENWDVANIEIEISRTTNGGIDFFIIGTVPLGTLTFADTVPDEDLINLEGLYINGGVQDNDPPPRSKFVHVVNDVGYYAFIQTSTSEEAYQVNQSVPGDIDSVPGANVAFTEQRIRGLSSIFDRPIVLCEHYIYRIDGTIDDRGGGDMIPVRIDDRAGCAGNNSIVQTHKGLFWAGDVGFYWTDGFQVKKISDNINLSYENLVLNEDQRQRITGTYEPSNERIIWSVSSANGGNEPDICYVLDLKWEENAMAGKGCFTTMSNGDSFRPTALAVNDNQIYRGDTRGYVFIHTDGEFTDPKVDPTRPTSEWDRLTIIHDYRSCFLDFGSKFVRKFVPRILVSAENTTNLSLAIESSNDNNRVTGSLQRIRYNANITWGEDLPLWSDPNAQWNFQGLIEQWRRFPAKGLRCQYKQVQFTNAVVDIVGSDLLGPALVDNGAKTATLSGTSQWLVDTVDYFITFETDNFTQEYLILTRTPTTITYEDSANTSPAGNINFIVRGKPKGEVLQLNGYVLHWAPLSKTHTAFGAGGV